MNFFVISMAGAGVRRGTVHARVLAAAASDGPLGAGLKTKHADAASLLDAIAREVGA